MLLRCSARGHELASPPCCNPTETDGSMQPIDSNYQDQLLEDADIISAFGDVLQRVSTSATPRGLQPLSWLPYAKETIAAALKRTMPTLTEPEIRDQMAQALVLLEDFVPDGDIPLDKEMRTAGSVARRRRLIPDCGPGEQAYLQWISSQIDGVTLAVDALDDIGQEFLGILTQQHASSHSFDNQKLWNESIAIILRARQDFESLQPTDLQVWPSYQRERYIHILDCFARITPILQDMMATASEAASDPGLWKTRELLAFEVVQESLPMLESIQARLHEEVFVRCFPLPLGSVMGPEPTSTVALTSRHGQFEDDGLNPCFAAPEAGGPAIERPRGDVEGREATHAQKAQGVKKHVFRQNKRGWYRGVITCMFCRLPRLVQGPERKVERLCTYCEWKLSGSESAWCDVCMRPLPLCGHAPSGLFEEWQHRLSKLAEDEEEIAARQGLSLREYRAWVDT